MGMLSGDGCLSIGHNGQGYRTYPIDFYNTNRKRVELFSNLFFYLFKEEGKIYSSKKKTNRRQLFNFRKYSVKTYNKLLEMGFPQGVKRDSLRVLDLIKTGSYKEKIYFIKGLCITDGAIKKDRGIMIHLGSKLFIQDVADLIDSLEFGKKKIKEFSQGRGNFKSYQLYLNKVEKRLILSHEPSWHNGTASVLS